MARVADEEEERDEHQSGKCGVWGFGAIWISEGKGIDEGGLYGKMFRLKADELST